MGILRLCSLCQRQVAGNAEDVELVSESFQCVLCFGILDPAFVSEVAQEVEKALSNLSYDATSFILALNLPVSQTLREIIIKNCRPDLNGILVQVPFKIRNINAYLEKLCKASGLQPTLNSDLQLTISFINDEFIASDLLFLRKNFPNDFCVLKKRENPGVSAEDEYSKMQLQQIASRINEDVAKEYSIICPSRKCSFMLSFERDPVFIAGRYCKYSRSLPQSPWSVEEKCGVKVPGRSVSEKVCNVMKKRFGAADSTFIASGREDIDVRMLGEGRPFVVELKNCQFTKDLKGLNYLKCLTDVEHCINDQKDINVKYLTRIAREDAEQLTVGQEDKRKWYTAYCYSTQKLSERSFQAALARIPVEVIQKTPVRVLKRRALLDRPRSIYSLELLRLDDYHFLARMETQAGTYVKEFVHGDFGRTRPSLADLLEVSNGEVDILELDVERVDQEWPLQIGKPISFV